jgi:phosphatidylglycerophosphatase A
MATVMPRPDMRRAWRERPISTFFATGAGIGMIPWAPGTWGSVEGLLLAVLIARVPRSALLDTAPASPLASAGEVGLLMVLAAAVFVLLPGILVSGRAEAMTDSRDPGAIVVDEVAGQMMASSPCALFDRGFVLWLVSFLLFRLFDIWKPGPIRRLQDLPGGWGIMLDDVAAGILAGVLTYGVGKFL